MYIHRQAHVHMYTHMHTHTERKREESKDGWKCKSVPTIQNKREDGLPWKLLRAAMQLPFPLSLQ